VVGKLNNEGGGEMRVAAECEGLFLRADNIGEGVAALGDMLQWAPDCDVQHILIGLGHVLKALGGDVQAVSGEYFDSSYSKILELEMAKEGIVDIRAARQAHEAPRSPREEELLTRVRTLLDDVLIKK
jgi:hypothetical protein